MAWAQAWNNLRLGHRDVDPKAAAQPKQYAREAVPRSRPAFLIAGPPRTGTSWLHEVLQPHACLPVLSKETRFFDLRYQRGFNWYLDRFPQARDGRPVGEIAPTYFASPPARERIAHTLPHVKLVFTFRHPVQRLISLYRLKRAYGMVAWSLETALERDPELIGSSRYAAHLAEWQRRFPSDQIQVNLFEDLQEDPQSFINRIAAFLGMPRFLLTPSQADGCHPHASVCMTQPRWYLATHAATATAEWCKGRSLDHLVAGLRNSRLSHLLLGGGAPFSEISRETLETLTRRLLPETEKLEALLSRDLSAWKRLPE